MRLPQHVENMIADFRGLPRPRPPSGRDSKPMDSLLEVLVERFHIGKIRPEQVIMENWRTIMGERDAHRCSPERIDTHGRLVVNVANPILRRELMFSRSRILRAIQAIEGCEHVTEIDFRAG